MDKFTLAEITKEKQGEYHTVTTNTAVHGLCLEWRLRDGGKYTVKDIVDQLRLYQSALIMGFEQL